MSTRQLEAELSAVRSRIQELRVEANRLELWEQRLQSALDVLLLVMTEGSQEPGRLPAEQTQDQPQKPRHRPPHPALARPVKERGLTPAVGKAASAGNALKEMLRTKGDYIKPLEAVRRLKEEYSLTIGLGKPGRETSDLSAALGHGKVEGLNVSRRLGWGLTEWAEARRIEPVGDFTSGSEINVTTSDEEET